MSEVKRTVRITTQQHILKDVEPVENFPMRQWSIEVRMLDQNGKEVAANILDKVTYQLHPTFNNPNRTIKAQPFKVEEKGWGEFDIPIILHLAGIPGKSGERKISHDLNFHKERYDIDHQISIPTNKSAALCKLLLETGPVPGFSADGTSIGDKRKNEIDSVNKNKKSKTATAIKGSIDLEKLASGLTKLNEDQLIVVVQMVTDNRTPDMSIKNDVDQGEFTMDLHTLPDSLLKSLWEYVRKHIDE